MHEIQLDSHPCVEIIKAKGSAVTFNAHRKMAIGSSELFATHEPARVLRFLGRR